MQILPPQIAAETRLNANDSLIAELAKAGSQKPQVVLVFEENEGSDKDQEPLKVRVFYRADKDMRTVNLDVPIVMVDTKLRPEDKNDVIKTFYPDGYVGYCTVIGGQPVWIT